MAHPRIGIDCRLSGLKHAGIGRYTENLIRRLPSLAPEIEWHYFFSDKKQAETVLSGVETKSISQHFAPIPHYSLAEQYQFPKLLNEAKLDLLHVPHFNIPALYQKPFVVTIHDLLWHQQKGTAVTTLHPALYWIKYLGYRYITNRAVFKAKEIFVPANTIKQALNHHYPQLKTPITVTYEGIGEAFLKAADPQAAVSSRSKTLVYTGSLYPHKNVGLVIRALQELPEYSLVLVGSRSIFLEPIKELIADLDLQDRVTLAGYLPDSELIKLYASAAALVQPSLSEGFGLTGIEAMAAGLPVVASDIPIFREIYQAGAHYFNPHSISSFVQAVESLKTLTLTELRTARDLVDHYSWDLMAEQTLEGYQRVIHSLHAS